MGVQKEPPSHTISPLVETLSEITRIKQCVQYALILFYSENRAESQWATFVKGRPRTWAIKLVVLAEHGFVMIFLFQFFVREVFLSVFSKR